MYSRVYQPYTSTIKPGAIRALGKIQLKPVPSMLTHPDIEKVRPKGMINKSLERPKI